MCTIEYNVKKMDSFNSDQFVFFDFFVSLYFLTNIFDQL